MPDTPNGTINTYVSLTNTLTVPARAESRQANQIWPASPLGTQGQPFPAEAPLFRFPEIPIFFVAKGGEEPGELLNAESLAGLSMPRHTASHVYVLTIYEVDLPSADMRDLVQFWGRHLLNARFAARKADRRTWVQETIKKLARDAILRTDLCHYAFCGEPISDQKIADLLGDDHTKERIGQIRRSLDLPNPSKWGSPSPPAATSQDRIRTYWETYRDTRQPDLVSFEEARPLLMDTQLPDSSGAGEPLSTAILPALQKTQSQDEADQILAGFFRRYPRETAPLFGHSEDVTANIDSGDPEIERILQIVRGVIDALPEEPQGLDHRNEAQWRQRLLQARELKAEDGRPLIRAFEEALTDKWAKHGPTEAITVVEWFLRRAEDRQ